MNGTTHLARRVDPHLAETMAKAYHHGRLLPAAAETVLIANGVDVTEVSRLDIARWLKDRCNTLCPKEAPNA